jgi:TetR/AcrR family transcriptional regulator, cholesterol catabolism regulator
MARSHLDKKNKILQAAAILFNDKSYSTTSMQEIADYVGIKKSSLYHYFRNKDELLYEIINSLTDKGIRELSKILKLDIPHTDKVRLAFLEHFSSYESSYPSYGVLLHEQINLLPHEKAKKIEDKFKQYIGLWRKLIEAGVKKKTFRQDLDVGIMVWSAVGMSNWVYKWVNPEGPLSFAQIANSFYSIFIQGIISLENNHSKKSK